MKRKYHINIYEDSPFSVEIHSNRDSFNRLKSLHIFIDFQQRIVTSLTLCIYSMYFIYLCFFFFFGPSLIKPQITLLYFSLIIIFLIPEKSGLKLHFVLLIAEWHRW